MNHYSNNKVKYLCQRFSAFFVDCFIVFIIYLSITIISTRILKHYLSKEELKSLFPIFIYIVNISALLIHAFYFIVIQSKYKTTIGKYIFKLKIIPEVEESIDIMTMFIRYLFFEFPITGFISAFLIIFDDKNQGLHDKIAKTYVVPM
ncbi:MAG: RDD family protein [bacterium]